MTALFCLWAALAADLALVLATRGAGLSWTLGAVHIRLHDPSNPLILAGIVAGALVCLSWPRPLRRGCALLAAFVVVAVAGAVIASRAERIFPIGDIAVLEIYARNALTGKLLVGPYSRFGWHHPGPAYFYLTAPFYAAAGRQPAALAAGAAAMAMGAVCLLAWSSGRSFGPTAPAVFLTFAALLLVRLPDLATSPWNPHVVVLPMLALLTSAAGLAIGDLVLLPVAVVILSLIVQTDLACVPTGLAVLVPAAAAGIVRSRQEERAVAPAKILCLTTWLAAALWFFPAAEQVAHSPGNATLLWRFFLGHPSAGQPWAVAFRAWATMLAAPFLPGLSLAGGGTFAADTPVLSMAVAAAEVAGLLVVAVRGDRQSRALASVGLLASAAGLWSVTRIADRIMDHEIFWLTAVGLFDAAVLAGSAAGLLGRRLPNSRLRLRASAAVAALAISLCVLVSVDQLGRARDGHLPVTLSMPAAGRLGASVRDYMRDHHIEKPVVRIGEDVWGLTAGVLLELDRSGVPFAVEESWMPMFPQGFAANGAEDAELTFSDASVHMALAERPGNVQVADAASTYIDAVELRR